MKREAYGFGNWCIEKSPMETGEYEYLVYRNEEYFCTTTNKTIALQIMRAIDNAAAMGVIDGDIFNI
jgi:hypothetical protein